jgi:Rrf2 family transcriptional regulator, cysteine metabolism repressor
MRISVRAQYALLAVFELSSNISDQPVKIAEISRRQRIPQKFLELILASLRQAGFVASRRGAEGGYLLAQPADTLTVGEVLRALDAEKRAGSRRQNDDESPLSDLWRKTDASVSAVLDRATFAELVRAWNDKQSRIEPNWDI